MSPSMLKPVERCIHEVGRPGNYHACLRRAAVVASSRRNGYRELHYCARHEAWAIEQYGAENVHPYVRGRYYWQ